MNFLGLDFGEKKIGLALSAGEISRPFLILRIKNQELGIKEISRICQKEEIKKIVIGIPEADQESDIVEKIRQFAVKLSHVVKLPVVFQDETLTSKEALQRMIEAGKGRKKRREEHAFAAAIILQEYLDKLKAQSANVKTKN